MAVKDTSRRALIEDLGKVLTDLNLGRANPYSLYIGPNYEVVENYWQVYEYILATGQIANVGKEPDNFPVVRLDILQTTHPNRGHQGAVQVNLNLSVFQIQSSDRNEVFDQCDQAQADVLKIASLMAKQNDYGLSNRYITGNNTQFQYIQDAGTQRFCGAIGLLTLTF